MRRAVIFVTLALLLLAVAGATAAQEGAFRGDGPTTGPPKSTTPEFTALETTEIDPESPEAAAPETTETDPETPEATAPEATKPEPDKPDASEGGPPEANFDDASEGKEEPEGERGDGGADEAEDGASNKAGDGGQKVTLCHKDKVTISVGAPAQGAHLRHGDALGACEAGSAGSKPGSGPKADDGRRGPGGGPPADRGRPEGTGKPSDTGKQPGGPRGRGNGAG